MKPELKYVISTLDGKKFFARNTFEDKIEYAALFDSESEAYWHFSWNFEYFSPKYGEYFKVISIITNQ